MVRDVQRLADRTFDLLVVGGGVYGLAAAYDAAQRGLSVALIERDDFGSGSSFNHLRTIHGGLRYLQTLDLSRARESICERRTIARIAPHTVAPLPFILPLRRSLARGKLAMRAAFLLDRALAFDRNEGIVASRRLPGGRVIGRDETIARCPGISRARVTGAAVWHDYVTIEPDRLTISYALAAAGNDAVLGNYVEGVKPLVDGGRVVGVQAKDRIGNREFEISSRLTVNATGAGVDQLLTPLGVRSRIPFIKALNLVTTRAAADAAVSAQSPSGRNLFLVPWRGRALFGTWESPGIVPPDATAPTSLEIDTFIAELNAAFPALDLTTDDVALVHRGVVPAVIANGGVALDGREHLYDHAVDGVEGLLSLVGTKYTTARAVAERATSLALTKLGRPAVPSRTATVPLPGGDLGDPETVLAAARRSRDAVVPAETLPHLIAAYGSCYDAVLDAATTSNFCLRISPDSPVVGAQLAWAARHEMAMTLVDAVVRRTPLGAVGYPGDDAAAQAAAIVGAELGWSEEQQRSETAQLKAFYEIQGR